MARSIILIAALAFIVLLGALTILTAIRHGVDILVAISALVLALFGFGIVGALLNPPRGPDA
jgi:hypothetical protein